MFGFKKKKERVLTAPTDGEIISIEKIGDEIFAKKILGEGFGVVPRNGCVHSPVCGVVTDVTETLHAYCIKTDDGAEVLVHIGIDTVELRGEGFSANVRAGDRVEKGTCLAEVDLDLLKARGICSTVVVVITNSDEIHTCRTLTSKSANAGEDAFVYELIK